MLDPLSYPDPLRKTVTWAGLATYTALAVLAVVFYKERIAFADLAFQLFTILQENNMTIQNMRFGAAITEIVPLLSGRLGLGLKTITVLYSLAFVGWYAFVFAVCIWSRATRWALVMLLLSTLMVTHTFYWAQSELPQGLAFMVLFMAVYQRWLLGRWPVWGLPVLTVGLFTLAFFHPTLFIPSCFCCLFFILRDKQGRADYAWLIVTLLLLSFIKTRVFHTGYDTENLKRTAQLFTLFPHYFSTTSFQKLLGWLVTDYYALTLGLLAVLAYYGWQRQWLRLALVGGSFLAYSILVTGSYPNGQEQQFYLENLLLPLTIFIAVPLAFDVLPTVPLRWAVGIVVLVVLVRVAHIGLAHSPYTDRLHWAQRVLRRTEHLPQRKLLFADQDIPMDTAMMTFATPYEFWLLSSLEKPYQARSIVICGNPDEHSGDLDKKNAFIAAWGVFDYAALPPKYFSFSAADTTTYRRADYKQLVTPPVKW